MKKQEILDLIAAEENSRVELKLDNIVRVTVGKASVKKSKSVGKTSVKIPSAICNNTNLAGVTERSVERNLQKMQNDGILRRVGGRKVGYWEVVD